LPVPYFHVVYTLPSKLRDIACQNKRVVYDLLMKAAAETTLAIAANPRGLGARIGITAVLHTWGSTLTHHPHVHLIVRCAPRRFSNTHAGLADKTTFKRFIAPLRRIKWVVYCKGNVRGTEASAALSVPLHPPCRHLQPPPHCSRRRRRRVPLERLSHRWSGTLRRPFRDRSRHPCFDLNPGHRIPYLSVLSRAGRVPAWLRPYFSSQFVRV
jgi:hypothetical protein